MEKQIKLKTKILYLPPEKHSEMILLAIQDLERIERDKRYQIDMDSHWHQPNSHCSVCFAGAVMAKSLKVSRDETFEYDDFGDDWEEVFSFLDHIRLGFWNDGFNERRFPNIKDYKDDPKDFKFQLRCVAAWFKSQGD